MDEANNNTNPYKAIIILLLLLFCGTVFYFFNKEANKEKNFTNTIEALDGGLTQYRNKLNQQVTEKQIITLSYSELKKIHASDSSTIGKLKKIITKNTTSATIIEVVTQGTLNSTKPSITFVADSIKKTDTTQKVLPTYSGIAQDKWSKIFYEVSADTAIFNYNFKNEFEFKQENKKSGFWIFGKQTPIISVLNKNPNTSTKSISSYAVAMPKASKTAKIITWSALVVSGIIIGVKISH